MNASQFLTLIQKGNALEHEDYMTLSRVDETFPYFQISSVLLAKYDYLKYDGEKKPSLHTAAIKTTDRKWLKMLMEDDFPFVSGKAESTIVQTPESAIVDTQSSVETISDIEQPVAMGVEPASEPDEKFHVEEAKLSLSNIHLQIADENELSSLPPENSQSQDKRADILKRLDENLSKLKKVSEEENEPIKEERDYKKEVRRPKQPDELIESIRKKDKKKVQDARKKEQMDIIKAFSKKEIKLAAIKENEDQQKLEDLSKSSTQLNESILSESYARLLVEQGKKEKAKEIYQKLSLKFPKKKAYFADLIKELA
ncbi:hypothetical protein [Pararhodonellum marinum]|uniref:hypothetical protein n=1 Tax=Pararhodonellum marinum TaxID=2755358 RepID=UPI001890843E|nr:hypothetical protein [Pararhodonellum marinum]